MGRKKIKCSELKSIFYMFTKKQIKQKEMNENMLFT